MRLLIVWKSVKILKSCLDLLLVFKINVHVWPLTNGPPDTCWWPHAHRRLPSLLWKLWLVNISRTSYRWSNSWSINYWLLLFFLLRKNNWLLHQKFSQPGKIFTDLFRVSLIEEIRFTHVKQVIKFKNYFINCYTTCYLVVVFEVQTSDVPQNHQNLRKILFFEVIFCLRF